MATPNNLNTAEEGGGGGGGFLTLTLPSPAPTTSTTTTRTTTLPRQRIHPLKPGGAKESALINYVDRKILRINRRHAKKFSSALTGPEAEKEEEGKEEEEDGEEATGYEGFRDVAKDVGEVIDVVWVSGTREYLYLRIYIDICTWMDGLTDLASLQIPYLISLAGLVNTYLPEYPSGGTSATKPIFRLLRKFDVMFASLLVGEDVESGVPLSGFEGGSVVSMTEKVRIKSVAETSRIVVVEMEVGDVDVYDDEDEDEEEEYGMDIDEDIDGIESRTWEMEAARVYERTIQYLGDELGRAEAG
jgi:Subunit 11 of the general transcription factor TFIIH